MPQLDTILHDMVGDAEGILGIAVVEIDSRKLVGSAQLNNDLSPAMLEAIGVSAVEMIRGKAVSAIESLISTQLAAPVDNSINDVCINTHSARIFITTIPNNADFLMIFSTKLSINMAMGWVLLREARKRISFTIAQIKLERVSPPTQSQRQHFGRDASTDDPSA